MPRTELPDFSWRDEEFEKVMHNIRRIGPQLERVFAKLSNASLSYTIDGVSVWWGDESTEALSVEWYRMTESDEDLEPLASALLLLAEESGLHPAALRPALNLEEKQAVIDRIVELHGETGSQYGYEITHDFECITIADCVKGMTEIDWDDLHTEENCEEVVRFLNISLARQLTERLQDVSEALGVDPALWVPESIATRGWTISEPPSLVS